MEPQLLIADADGCLSDHDLKSCAAQGSSVRVTSGGVECLTALRETPPDVLLDTELKFGGVDGVLSVLVEEDDLSTIPVMLFNDDDTSASLPEPSSHAEEWITLKCGDQIAIPASQDQSTPQPTKPR